MSEVSVRIPEELEAFKSVSGIDWQLVVDKKVNEELQRISEIKRILSKSKMTQEEAEKLSDEINTSLAERYEKLAKG